MSQQQDSTAISEKATALLTIDHVRAAAGRIAGQIVETPMLHSQTLSKL